MGSQPSAHADCIAFKQDIDGCSDVIIGRIQTMMNNLLCAPEHRADTQVSLGVPRMMGESVIITARLQRGERSVVFRSVVDIDGSVHMLPYAESDQD